MGPQPPPRRGRMPTASLDIISTKVRACLSTLFFDRKCAVETKYSDLIGRDFNFCSLFRRWLRSRPIRSGFSLSTSLSRSKKNVLRHALSPASKKSSYYVIRECCALTYIASRRVFGSVRLLVLTQARHCSNIRSVPRASISTSLHRSDRSRFQLSQFISKMVEIPTYQIGIFVFDLTFSIEKKIAKTRPLTSCGIFLASYPTTEWREICCG